MENHTRIIPNSTGPAMTDGTMALVMGVSYITVGTIFIPLQLLCAYLIYTDKDMNNPTYRFMITLSVVDAIELAGIGLYAGAVLVSNVQYEMGDRVVGYIILSVWYTSVVYLVLVSFSRYIAITRPEHTKVIFTDKVMRALQICPWIVILAIYFYPTFIIKGFYFIPEYFTWTFAVDTTVGEIVHWSNFIFCSSCAIIEGTFNILSLLWVHKVRKSISPTVASDGNQRREIKLLLQCTIIGFIFAMTEISYTTAMIKRTKPMFLFVQILWTLNHCDNPVIYFIMNSKLRQRFFKLFTGTKTEIDAIGTTVGRA